MISIVCFADWFAGNWAFTILTASRDVKAGGSDAVAKWKKDQDTLYRSQIEPAKDKAKAVNPKLEQYWNPDWKK